MKHAQYWLDTIAEGAEKMCDIVDQIQADAQSDLIAERDDLLAKLAAGRVQVCAWCQKEGRLNILGSPEMSHGICVAHREAEIEKHQRARAAQEGG